MTYRILAIAALAWGPALAQAPAQPEPMPLSPSAAPAKAVRSSASGEPGTSERQVGGPPATSIMGAGPARPMEDSANRAPVQAVPLRLPSPFNETPNGGPN
ncbi:hypothetical protein [Ramlibacter sp. Leaf400]|uniref:hypothetical protein n=1 Tax=Ramlibacter sp. Leaf400 TaxID=1736365 RepID=UPI0006F6E38B|nr:hypothetical protein [Ramlibacter sp. Leaf400]KQT07558.1 hypothetical protein ASG30_17120 [Ramlibacter sp. Leaf400]